LKYKIVFLILLLAFYLNACEKTCKSVTGPNPPEPPVEPKNFTIQVKYVRPLGSILQPDLVDKVGSAIIVGQSYSYDFLLITKLDDYHFESKFDSLPDNENGPLYSIYTVDAARWDRLHDDTAVVGDAFFILVKETGFEKQLTNVVANNLPACPYKGPDAKMALFRLKKDGKISDN